MSAQPCGCDPDSGHLCDRDRMKNEVREMLLALREDWNHDDKGWLACDQALKELEKL